MSSDQDKDNLSSEGSIEEIKKEETEDPTAYYAQGDSKEKFDEMFEGSAVKRTGFKGLKRNIEFVKKSDQIPPK